MQPIETLSWKKNMEYHFQQMVTKLKFVPHGVIIQNPKPVKIVHKSPSVYAQHSQFLTSFTDDSGALSIRKRSQRKVQSCCFAMFCLHCQPGRLAVKQLLCYDDCRTDRVTKSENALNSFCHEPERFFIKADRRQ